jgi:hypothetical protein
MMGFSGSLRFCLAMMMIGAVLTQATTWESYLFEKGYGSPTKFCSKAEIAKVLNAADPVPVLASLMTSNPPCGACVTPCERLTGFDRILCNQACQHQSENRCTNDTLAWLDPLIERANLSNRDSLTTILDLAEADCAYCVLETIEFVCGDLCVFQQLHIWHDFPIHARPCVSPEKLALGVTLASLFTCSGPSPRLACAGA